MDTERTPLSTHTPGPLDIKPAIKPNGPEGSWDVGIFDAEDMIIAECFEIVGPGIRRPAMANALLFAAAPELLAACKRAKKLLEPEVTKEPDRTIFWELVSAIAKAQGRAA